MSDDLAAILADLPEPERLPPGRLSKLQRAILTATAVAIYNDNGWDDPEDLPATLIPRRTAYCATAARHWIVDPDRSWERQERAHRTSFDRALSTLHKRGYVIGLALAWVLVSHDGGNDYEDVWGWQGGGRRKAKPSGLADRAPTLKRVGLTDKGWQAVDVNGRRLGDLLDLEPGDTRQTEADYCYRIAQLVGSIVDERGDR